MTAKPVSSSGPPTPPSKKEELLNSDDSKNITHSSQPKKVPYPSDTKLLKDRSATKIINISAEQFNSLVLNRSFDSRIHYKVEGDVNIDQFSWLHCPSR